MARKPIISADEIEWRRRKAHQPRHRTRDERIALSSRSAFASAGAMGLPAAPATPGGGGTPYGAMAALAVAQSAQAIQGMPGNSGVPYPDMGEISATKAPQGMMGATGTAIFSGVIQNDSKGEYNSDWYWRDFVPIIDQMRRSDGQIQAIEQAVRLPIQRATWSITPASGDGADQVIASFVESCLIEGMVDTTTEGDTVRTTWRETIEQILMYLWYGFMVFELCYSNPRLDPDGYVRWARWLPMLPRTVWRWWTNAQNDLVGIQQWTYRDYLFKFINVKAGKLLRFHHRMEGNNYDGWSLLRAAYMHWFHKVNLLNIAAVGVERNSISPPHFSLPAQSATQADYQNALTMAQNIRANEQLAIVTPDSWKVEYLNMRERQAEQVIPLIQYHDQLIARSVLAQFINLGSTETGAYSLDSSQKLTFLNALQSVAEYVADVINADAIKKLVDYNYAGVTVYPKLVCSKLVSQDLTILSDTLQKLVQYFPPSPELNDYLARELGLPATPQSFTQTTAPGQDAGGGADYQSDGSDRAQDAGTQDTNTQDGERGGYGNGDNGSSGGYGEGGDSGGGAYSEVADLRDEVVLLREALNGVYGMDAVERGYEHETVRLYSPDQARNRGKFAYEGAVRALEGARAKEERAAAAHAKAKPGLQRALEAHGRAMKSGDSERIARATQRFDRASLTHDKAEGRHMQATAARKDAEQRVSAAAHAEAVVARNNGAAGGGGAKAASESIHERSARLQREGNLPRESQPGEKLVVVHGRPLEDKIPDLNHIDVRGRVYEYGEHQLGNVLDRTRMPLVRDAAKREGIPAGGTKAELISNLTAHVTEGRYSANFGGGTAKAGAGGAAKTTAGATRAPKADAFARIDSKLGTLEDPTNANAAWEKFGGTRAGFREMLSHEPLGTMEEMATRNGMGLPKGYEAMKAAATKRGALATHISDHMAQRNGQPTAAQERAQARAATKVAKKSAAGG